MSISKYFEAIYMYNNIVNSHFHTYYFYRLMCQLIPHGSFYNIIIHVEVYSDIVNTLRPVY